MLSSFTHFLLDLLFPTSCLRCEKEGSWLCGRCQALLPATLRQEGAWSLLPYHEPWVMRAVHALKYSGASELGRLFGRLLAERWPNHLHVTTNATVVTAIPLHKRRERERGFNQAERIAREFAFAMKLPYAPLLTRAKATQPQARLDHDERQRNIVGVFARSADKGTLDKKTKLVFPLKTVILIDDVVTTGATLREAEKTLCAHDMTITVFRMTIAYAPKRVSRTNTARRVGRVA